MSFLHYFTEGDPGKPRFGFRLDLDLYGFLRLTTMSEVEILDWFTIVNFRLATQSFACFKGPSWNFQGKFV